MKSIFRDLYLNERNIIFACLFLIFIAVINILSFTKLNDYNVQLEIYNKLKCDYTAEGVAINADDDTYYYISELFYSEKDELDLIEANILMQLENNKYTEKSYNNEVLIKEGSYKELAINELAISSDISDKYNLHVNDIVTDTQKREYKIAFIVETIDGIFGDSIENNSLIIAGYDKNKVNDQEDKYFSFCVYNDNVYSDIFLSKKNKIRLMNENIKKTTFFYIVVSFVIFFSHLLVCKYQFRYERVIRSFGATKFKLILGRFLSNLILYSIILIPNIILLLIINQFNILLIYSFISLVVLNTIIHTITISGFE